MGFQGCGGSLWGVLARCVSVCGFMYRSLHGVLRVFCRFAEVWKVRRMRGDKQNSAFAICARKPFSTQLHLRIHAVQCKALMK